MTATTLRRFILNELFERNLSIEEQTRRYIIGAPLIAVVLFKPSMPAWLTMNSD